MLKLVPCPPFVVYCTLAAAHLHSAQLLDLLPGFAMFRFWEVNVWHKVRRSVCPLLSTLAWAVVDKAEVVAFPELSSVHTKHCEGPTSTPHQVLLPPPPLPYSKIGRQLSSIKSPGGTTIGNRFTRTSLVRVVGVIKQIRTSVPTKVIIEIQIQWETGISQVCMLLSFSRGTLIQRWFRNPPSGQSQCGPCRLISTRWSLSKIRKVISWDLETNYGQKLNGIMFICYHLKCLRYL